MSSMVDIKLGYSRNSQYPPPPSLRRRVGSQGKIKSRDGQKKRQKTQTGSKNWRKIQAGYLSQIGPPQHNFFLEYPIRHCSRRLLLSKP